MSGAISGAFAQNVSSDAPVIDEPIARAVTTNVVAPVLVTDRRGFIIDGLQPPQFHLFDNGKEQNIQVDVSFEPLSVVVAVETSSRVDAILQQVKHLGVLMGPVLLGGGGQSEAAVLGFDSRLQVLQDFTADPDKLKATIDKIHSGASGSRMVDAVDRAVYMLRRRPQNSRRIVLLVSETRDQGSEGRLREALIDAQLSNVQVYTVNITQLATRLTEKPQAPRPDPVDVTARNMPMGIPSTPTTAAQNYGVQNEAQFAPLLKEIYIDAKGLFVDNPAQVFTKGTGGAEYSFLKQKGLEDAVQRISQEIRSEYLISYRPNNMEEGGFHEITVTLDRPDLVPKTRPGYWVAGGKAQ
jgi:VWFA-related protein